MSSFEDFWDEFMERFSRAPVWLPGTRMAVGEIGVIERRGFLRIAHISDFDIEFQTEPSDVNVEYFVSSSNAQAEDFAISASAIDPTGTLSTGQAGMRMTFSSAGAFVVRARRVRGERISDVLAVENQIKNKNKTKSFWKKEWVYVQEVSSAAPCILVVSAGSGAAATVSAGGSVGVANFVELLDAGAQLSLGNQKSIDQFIATHERTPLMWRGRWLKGLIRAKFADRGDSWNEAEVAAAAELYEDFDDADAYQRDISDSDLRALGVKIADRGN